MPDGSRAGSCVIVRTFRRTDTKRCAIHKNRNSGKTWSGARYSAVKFCGTGYFAIARSRVTRRNVASRPILWFHNYAITRILLGTQARCKCFFQRRVWKQQFSENDDIFYIYFWWIGVVEDITLDHFFPSLSIYSSHHGFFWFWVQSIFKRIGLSGEVILW
jgi:hypothetical protein